MRNIKLVIAYDGTDFSGWQRQPDRRTVQQVLEESIAALTGSMPATNASGRTDAGVHAMGQVVHFLTASEHSTEVIAKALNAKLPPDIRVLSAEDKPQAFHCTLDARSKRYRYVIDNGRIADPFSLRYAWHVYPPLDEHAMRRAGQALVGRHDFRSFETNWPNRTSSVRTIFALDVSREGDRVWVEVEADGFLYNMVRAIAGTLVVVGSGRRPESFPGEAMEAMSRSRAGPTAPPQGLFLFRVHYPE
jgi:tRNA pseudouridine38-40 synthase